VLRERTKMESEMAEMLAQITGGNDGAPRGGGRAQSNEREGMVAASRREWWRRAGG
jgi:hypothetical protein